MSALTTLPLALAADAALPARDTLRDEAAVRDLLTALGTDRVVEVTGATPIRMNYQVGRSLRAVFRATIDHETRIVAARMFRRGKSADAYARAYGAVGSGRLRGVAHAASADTVLWLFPNDRKIDALAAVLDGSAPSPAPASAPRTRRRLAAYAPEKSATIACVDGDDRPLAYAKVAAAHQAARDYRTYNSLRAGLAADDRRLRLPCPLAYSVEHRTLWLEAVPGRRLADAEDGSALDDLRRFGMAVATFHGLTIPDAPRFDRFSPIRLHRDAEIVGVVRPDAAGPALHLARRLSATEPLEEGTPACLHGDLHPKNAIVSDGRVALIDVEDVAIGPAAADIGSLLASLLYLHVGGRLARGTYAAHADAFLSGYADARALPARQSIAWHTAAALFVERAVRAITRIRPLGLAYLADLVAAAERVLDGGSEFV